MDIGFVIMPFGDDFDDIYREIYAPVIKAAGLESLRADEIYNNQPIIQDINHSIHSAKVILADVTGRNPNVNYELGAAHALGKEVIIVTANPDDVPSDYRHIRYIRYNRRDIDWNRKLSQAIGKTLQTVLDRLRSEGADADTAFELTASFDDALDEEIDEDIDFFEKAKAEGFESIFYNPVHSLLLYKDSRVRVDIREGGSSEWWAAITYLLDQKVRKLAEQLPKGHYLKMRWAFIDNHASHCFGIDYIYRSGSLPILTKKELWNALYDEFCGQIFEPEIRYLEENIDLNGFDPNDDQYYSLSTLPQERHPICWRNGCYIAEIESVYKYVPGGHYFYRLKGLLPLNRIDAQSYAHKESHWLADWSQNEPRCAQGDIVSFKLQRVYPPTKREHASNARNLNFSELTKIIDHNNY